MPLWKMRNQWAIWPSNKKTGDKMPWRLMSWEILQAVPGSPTKLIFLSACESAKGGDKSLASTLLNGGVIAVLAMKETVTVEATIALSKAIYAALGAGMTIADAFKNSLPALSRLPDSLETGTKAKTYLPCRARKSRSV
jgi:CHAT domain-containing protein